MPLPMETPHPQELESTLEAPHFLLPASMEQFPNPSHIDLTTSFTLHDISNLPVGRPRGYHPFPTTFQEVFSLEDSSASASSLSPSTTSGYFQTEFGDSDEEIFEDSTLILGGNIADSIPGPYSTPWFPGRQDLWSRDLIEMGIFDSTDAALLAFIVDCSMKLYIVSDIEIPSLEMLEDSDLVWSVITETQRLVRRDVQNRGTHSSSPGLSALSVENLMLCAARDLPKIRQRCKITFRQAIQSCVVKYAFAFELTDNHSRFKDMFHELASAFQWVYGKHPSFFVNTQQNHSVSSFHGISIRHYVFDYN
ncbi:hypothetical protein BKA66DRAFT_614666 [Pyrenochaeta sp. MPI-SDFR-AT-0127]|nr:hypothetical protein BKA66DRAFT_614666 [Pyrenochaeta sp. MPI-SDFR-AT-0127]